MIFKTNAWLTSKPHKYRLQIQSHSTFQILGVVHCPIGYLETTCVTQQLNVYETQVFLVVMEILCIVNTYNRYYSSTGSCTACHSFEDRRFSVTTLRDYSSCPSVKKYGKYAEIFVLANITLITIAYLIRSQYFWVSRKMRSNYRQWIQHCIAIFTIYVPGIYLLRLSSFLATNKVA